MTDVLSGVSDVIRWSIPATGLAITFLAWRRLRSPGSRIAVAAFALTMFSPVIRLIIREVIVPQRGFTPQDLGLISTTAGAVSLIGLIAVVFAMRRMIASAEAQVESDSLEGEPP